MQVNKNSPRYFAEHIQDKYTDLGYDYRKTIFKKTLSPVIYENENNSKILTRLSKVIAWLVDTVKQIKLQYMISLPKNSRLLN